MVSTRGRHFLLSLVITILAGCGDDLPEGPAVASEQARISQDRIDASLAAAERYFDNGENEKAETIVLALLKREPDQPRAHELMASILIARADGFTQRGDSEAAADAFAGAYEHYAALLAKTAPSAGLEQSAGRVALAADLTELALTHFRKAAELDPADPSNPLLEANLLLQLDRISEARAAIDRAVKLDPEEPYALATLAMVLAKQGHATEALERIAEARELAGPADKLGIRVVEARLHRQNGDPDRALTLLLPLSERERGEQAVASEIAASSIALGQFRQAIDAWAHRYRFTEDWRAALAAAEHALSAEQIDEAWRWFRRAELIAPSAHEVRDFYARLRDSSATEDSRTGSAGGG